MSTANTNSSLNDQVLPVIIIGTGPAGHTAALYCSRANLAPIIFEGAQPGGQLTTTTEVENFPGFPEGIMGPELMENMKKQSARFGAQYVQATITDTDFSQRPFTLTDHAGKTYKAHSVIIASGATAKYLGLPNEMALIGKGVSACATCDGFFFKNKIVHVVGGGDTAMEEAMFLSKFASQVIVVHRRDTLRASKAMQDRCLKNPKIQFLFNSAVEEILADEHGVHSIRVKNLNDQKIEERKTDGLFMAIGHTPNTGFLKNQLPTDSLGYLATKPGSPETEIPGIFACGDVQDHVYRQAITAAGSGCQAAIKVERYLEEQGLSH